MNHTFKEIIRCMLDSIDVFKLTIKERNRILMYNQKSRLESLMLVATHSLEKGMGIKNTRRGYGQKKARNIIHYLNNYCKKYDCACFPFIESYKMIETYIEFQKQSGFDISSIETLFDDFKNNNKVRLNFNNSEVECGVEFYDAEYFNQAKEFDFSSFTATRHSIRDFKEEIVSVEEIKQAIQIANHSPSACNRQPIKVYCTNSEDKANIVDELITGTSGFKNSIQNFAIVTSDRSYFAGREIYQWYVNGGIYLSFLILAFHSLGIGSVIMQWYPFYKTEKKLKKVMGINKSEAIVGIIGFGYYPEKIKCIKAQRKSVDETLVIQ